MSSVLFSPADQDLTPAAEIIVSGEELPMNHEAELH
jgi:hypothetical protein